MPYGNWNREICQFSDLVAQEEPIQGFLHGGVIRPTFVVVRGGVLQLGDPNQELSPSLGVCELKLFGLLGHNPIGLRVLFQEIRVFPEELGAHTRRL